MSPYIIWTFQVYSYREHHVTIVWLPILHYYLMWSLGIRMTYLLGYVCLDMT